LIVTALVVSILLYTMPILMPSVKATNLSASPPSFWVEPETESFNAVTTPVGTLFNVTVWGSTPVNDSAGLPTFAWQVNLGFNTSQLQAVAAGFTAGSSSELFAGHGTIPLAPVITNTGSGSVLAAESLLAGESVGAKSASLFWVEFNVSAAPMAGQTFTCNIDPGYGLTQKAGTKFLDTNTVVESGLSTAPCTYIYTGPAIPPPPIAAFTYSPAIIIVGQPVTFNASTSYSPGGTIVSWNWAFGDNGIASGQTVTHTYSSTGTFDVNLTVTDNNSLTNSTTEQVTVYASLPAELYVDPSQIINLSMAPSSTFYVNITLTALTSLSLCAFNLTYDPQVLNWIGVDFWPIPQYPTAYNFSAQPGYISQNLAYVNVSLTGTPTPIVQMHFDVIAYGITPLSLTDIILLDSNGNSIAYTESNGLFANIIRDVAVTNVVPSQSWVYEGSIDDINVTVANFGNVSETFTVTALYNSTVIATAPITGLAPGGRDTVAIPWDTTGVPQSNNTITGKASFVPYETYFNTTNNVFVDGIVQVLTVIHDVAITNVTPTLSWVYANSTVPVNVTAANLGNVSESFTVTAYYSGNGLNGTVGTLPVTNLANNTSTVLTFNWNTAGITTEGYYAMSAYASPVPFEYNLTNNYLVGGSVLVLTQIRDVEITNVTAASPWWSNWAYQGATVNVTVTAENDGQVTESFYVSAYVGTSMIGNVSIASLAPGATAVEVFPWNTSNVALYQNYTISGQASLVQYEFNATNNVFVDGTFTVRLVGDVNGDEVVDLSDVSIVAEAFGTSIGQPGYVRAADITGAVYLVPDGVIDLMDIATVSINFGKSA
jgi:PKD repeat protein